MNAKVTLDGKEVEIPLGEIKLPEGSQLLTAEQLTEGYVPRSQLQGKDAMYVLKAELERRLSGTVKRATAAQDPDVIKQVLASHKPTEPEKGKGVDLEAAKRTWAEAELSPVKAQLDALQTQIVGAAIREAAKDVFAGPYTQSPVKGRPSSVETWFAGSLKYDNDLGYVVAVDEAGAPIPSANPTAARPYMDAGEYQKAQVKTAPEKWGAYVKKPEPNRIAGAGRQAPTNGARPKRSAMTATEKAHFVRDYGVESYQALPE